MLKKKSESLLSLIIDDEEKGKPLPFSPPLFFFVMLCTKWPRPSKIRGIVQENIWHKKYRKRRVKLSSNQHVAQPVVREYEVKKSHISN